MRPGRGSQMWLRARKPGFLEQEGWRDSATTASPGVDATIAIVPEALIKGRVTLSTGDVAGNINVQLFSRTVLEGFPRWVPGDTVRANSAGEFRFAELRPGSYKLVDERMDGQRPGRCNPRRPTLRISARVLSGVRGFFDRSIDRTHSRRNRRGRFVADAASVLSRPNSSCQRRRWQGNESNRTRPTRAGI